jgi:ABC-type oligopeptide transport system substrate-binding subunit
MRKRGWFWLPALVAALLLAAAGCGGDDDDDNGAAADGGTITFAWGAEPPSLDPGLATDTTSANVLSNIMDPLVVLEGENLEPQANLAESWEESDGGRVITFTLREDGQWTNGDPVVAEDFVYSWKRTLSPELGADYAYQLYGIEGAQEYNECEENCDAVADQVGVEAVDERTLRVTLTSAQPWFVQLVAHHSFLAVHRPTVEQFGERWTEAANIVTNGPYQLAAWEHEARIDMVKWDEWRDADSVSIERVDGRIITEGTTAVQAFEAGEVDALDSGLIPSEEMARWKEDEAYYQSPALGTYYYGFNMSQITDVNQRRAMSLAIDRQTIVDQIAQGGEVPADGFTPEGMAGFDTINVDSPWAPANGDLARAQELMSQVQNPVTNVTLFHNNAPGHREIAVAVQGMWRELGITVEIRQQEWAQFLEFLGPPPNNAVDVYRLGWIFDYPDAMNGLELWTSESGNNNTTFANEEFDRLVDEARATPDDDERYELYQQLEDLMFGEEGEMPLTPIYWYTNTSLVSERLRDSFEIDPQTFIHFYRLSVSD